MVNQPNENSIINKLFLLTGRNKNAYLPFCLWLTVSIRNFVMRFIAFRMQAQNCAERWLISLRSVWFYSFQHGVSFGSSATLRSIPFNTYDSKNHVRRQSLLGRYRLDPNTGAPLNPMGRTGLLGKGLLPRWGPNHSVAIVVTRWSRNPKSGTPVLRGNKGVLKVVALERLKRFCLPWVNFL